MPELSKDPIVGRWVIISTDRAKRPTDFVRESVKRGADFARSVPATRTRRRLKFWRIVRTAPRATGRAGPCAWCPTSFPRLASKAI